MMSDFKEDEVAIYVTVEVTLFEMYAGGKLSMSITGHRKRATVTESLLNFNSKVVGFVLEASKHGAGKSPGLHHFHKPSNQDPLR